MIRDVEHLFLCLLAICMSFYYYCFELYWQITYLCLIRAFFLVLYLKHSLCLLTLLSLSMKLCELDTYSSLEGMFLWEMALCVPSGFDRA